MINRLLLVFVILFYCKLSFCQEQQIDCANNLLINQNVNNLKVLKYDKGFLAKKINSFNEVKNSSPEFLMSSVLSASDLSWYNSNREKKKKKVSQDFEYIKNVSSSEYYFELLYKVTFEANGFEYAIIKYYLHNKGKVIGFAESMKKIDNRWFTTSESGISNFLFFMVMIDVNYIDAIFKGEKSNNSVLNTIIFDNKKNNRINLNGTLLDLEKGLSSSNKELELILDSKRLFK